MLFLTAVDALRHFTVWFLRLKTSHWFLGHDETFNQTFGFEPYVLHILVFFLYDLTLPTWQLRAIKFSLVSY
jgi:hypothetical protein